MKFNDVGSDCPRFVAADFTNVPVTTSDAFDLAKLSKNIDYALNLESRVSESFATLSCLQIDCQSILHKCNKIAMLTDEIIALKLPTASKDGGLPLTCTQSSSSVVNYGDLDSQSGVSSVKSELSDDELQVLDADDELEEPSQETVKPKVVKETLQVKSTKLSD